MTKQRVTLYSGQELNTRMISGIMTVYQLALLVCDFIHLLFRTAILCAVGVWRFVYPKTPKSVSGELVLVTGAGHGIGKELSLQFARLGAKVICLDVNETTNNKTVSDIGIEGGTAWGYCCDVSNKEDVHKTAIKIQNEVGEVGILINNAGIMPCKPFLQHSPEDVKKIYNVNVFSHFWTIQEWLPSFISRGTGHIVAISSITGLVPTANLVPYCSSKFAVRGLMEGLIEELRYAGRYPNIRLTTVYPFVVDTGLAKKPRIRFPSFNPITSPEECAAKIIEGVRREEEVISIPAKDFYCFKFASMLPREVYKVCYDFLDTGVDEDEC